MRNCFKYIYIYIYIYIYAIVFRVFVGGVAAAGEAGGMARKWQSSAIGAVGERRQRRWRR
jgi:hypothetical protein